VNLRVGLIETIHPFLRAVADDGADGFLSTVEHAGQPIDLVGGKSTQHVMRHIAAGFGTADTDPNP
jgi:hypothetical protein